jgi:hypothetical protein
MTFKALFLLDRYWFLCRFLLTPPPPSVVANFFSFSNTVEARQQKKERKKGTDKSAPTGESSRIEADD